MFDFNEKEISNAQIAFRKYEVILDGAFLQKPDGLTNDLVIGYSPCNQKSYFLYVWIERTSDGYLIVDGKSHRDPHQSLSNAILNALVHLKSLTISP